MPTATPSPSYLHIHNHPGQFPKRLYAYGIFPLCHRSACLFVWKFTNNFQKAKTFRHFLFSAGFLGIGLYGRNLGQTRTAYSHHIVSINVRSCLCRHSCRGWCWSRTVGLINYHRIPNLPLLKYTYTTVYKRFIQNFASTFRLLCFYLASTNHLQNGRKVRYCIEEGYKLRISLW